MKLAGLHKDELKETLERKYGFEIKRMKYILAGENGASYVAVLGSGDKVFVNVGKLKWISIHRQRNTMNYLVNLRRLLKFENIAMPIRSKNGKLAVLHENFPVSVMEYLEGKNPKEDFIPQPKQLARMIAKLHNFKSDKFPGVKQEELTLRWENKILSFISKIEKSRHEELKKILKGKSDFFRAILKRVKKLKKHVESKKKKYVLVHTDLHEGNLYLSGNRVFVLDWESLEKALPEKDLLFFVKNKLFMKEYSKLTGHKVDKDALDYYRLKRGVSDIVYFVRELLEKEDIEKKIKRNYLRVIREEVEYLQSKK